MLKSYQNINVFPTEEEVGIAAGKAVEVQLLKLLQDKEIVRMIFAAAPSQDYLLDYLAGSSRIPWDRIVAFNMDEYVGLAVDAPQLFSRYLKDRLFSKIDIKEFHTINAGNSTEQEIARFTSLITEDDIDIVCLGIGENGHLAFNDPPVADFDDPEVIKKVELDLVCRNQQVRDECFSTLEEVPTTALTLTIPTLLRGKALFCVVVGDHKREAVKQALLGPISTEWPASILRKHPNCQYFFDQRAYDSVEEDVPSSVIQHNK